METQKITPEPGKQPGRDKGFDYLQNSQKNTESQLLIAALAYAERNLPVFPCKRDKTPYTNHGFLDATTDLGQIKAWWKRWPNASIGMATGEVSRVWVFDTDIYKPGAPEALNKLLEKNGPLPQTRISKTGGGGIQYFFKYPDIKIPSRNGHLGPGLDVKGEGGYVVLPPSLHPSGEHYRWIDESPSTVAPTWLIELVKDKPHKPLDRPANLGNSTAYALKALENEALKVSHAPEGQRNEILNQAAFSLGQLVAGGELSSSLVENTLADSAQASGLPEKEARRTIQSGFNGGRKEPRTVPESNRKTYRTEQAIPQHFTQSPEPLPTELLPVAPFDFALLPDALTPWAEDICERVQCPPDFVAAGIMAGLGSLIGRKLAIRPQAKTDWTVVPNMWALIVGRPGVLKSPALEAALAPVKRLVAEATERYQAEIAEHKKEEIAAKLRKEAAEKKAREVLKKDPEADLSALFAVDEPNAPTLKRYISNDSTPASLGELLRQNPNGLLVFRDEIVSLLKSLDREGQEEGRGFYLTAWNGDSPYTFDRIGRGLNLHIQSVCLSVLGGTQPGRLSEYINHAVKGGAADDGLIQRFGLLVWPDMAGTWKDIDRFPDNEAKKRAFKIFKALDDINPLEIGAEQDTDFNGEPDGPPYLRFDSNALELFQEWRANLETRLRSDELHPALESHLAKYRKLIPSLALILHLANGEIGPVAEKATMQALAWSEYLETHAQRAYGSISQPEITVAKAILKRITKGDLPPSFRSHDVWRPGWAKLSDRDQVLEGLKLLEDYGWIAPEKVETGGRPKVIFHAHEGARK